MQAWIRRAAGQWIGGRQRAGYLALVATCVLCLGAGAGSAWAGTANRGLKGASKSNPLAGIKWGVYSGPIDGVYPAYQSSRGRNRQLMAKIALKPLTVWTGAWYADDYIRTVAQQIIQGTTGGNPDLLTQIAVFRMDPWEVCPGSWGPAAQSSYRAWINQFAAGIGNSRVAVILQPDLPYAMCAGTSVPLQLVDYASLKLTALPHTTVYLDAGAAQWLSPGAAASMLEQAGIKHVRGFSLDVTQYGSTGMELEYGDQVLRMLGAAGIRNKHFVVNTDENGSPFLAGQVSNANETRACNSPQDRLCVTLGIPPTTNVASPRWGLSPGDRAIARRDADAYLWAGRPWVDNNSGSFVYSRALQLAASSPF